MKRRVSLVVLAALAALVLATPALAGGWAIITLDSLPQDVRAGQPLQIGFVVRQHGVTPTNIDLDGQPLKPVITIKPLAGQADAAQATQLLQFTARQQGETGHYVAEVIFPSAGQWAWSISAPTYMVQTNGDSSNAAEFEPLTVAPASVAEPAPSAAPIGLAGALRWAGLALLLAALVVFVLARRPAARRAAAAD